MKDTLETNEPNEVDMTSSLKQLFSELDKINQRKDKSSEDKKSMDEIVLQIIENEKLAEDFLHALDSTSKWNPSILNAFSKHLRIKSRDEGLTETRLGLFLAVFRSNRRGVWLTDLCEGLSFLLVKGVPEALEILRVAVEKPRSSKDPDVYTFYSKTFLNTLRPMSGLPYLVSAWVKSYPDSSHPHFETLISKLVEKCRGVPPVNLIEPARKAFTEYLQKRAVLQQPLKEFEPVLLKLLKQHDDPEWEACFQAIGNRASEDAPDGESIERKVVPDALQQAEAEARPAKEHAVRRLRPKTERPVPVASRAAQEAAVSIVSSTLESLEISKNAFLRDLASFAIAYKNLNDLCDEKSRLLAKREQKIDRLTERRLELEAEFSRQREMTKEARSRTQELEGQVNKLMEDQQQSERRSDERVHQIQMQAENDILKFKHELWYRLRPDLDDLIRNDLHEDDYATPDRGRSLYRRLQDIMKILKSTGIIPGTSAGE